MMFFGRMSWLLTRTMMTFFISVIIAALALVLLGFYAPDLSIQMLDAAGVVENWLRDTLLPGAGVPATANYWVRWLIDDNQLLFLFFVVVARVIVSIVLEMTKASYKATRDVMTPKRDADAA